jgi:preprotein translocase subunit SecY
MGVFKTIRRMLSIKDLRVRIAYTLFFVTLYRLGTYVFLPWIDPYALKKFWDSQKSANMWDQLIGTSLDSYSIFSLGIQPYISASIVVQLASFAFPYFQRLQQEGIAGRSKLNQITRRLTILIALLQGIPAVWDINPKFVLGGATRWFYVSSLMLMTASTVFSVWMADKITEKGLGIGASVLIMVGMMAKFPKALKGEIMKEGQNMLFLILVLVGFFCVVLIIITFMQGTRKIRLQYARQMMVATHSYQGTRQYLPIKMNATGVMPVIFASILVGIVQYGCDKLKEQSDIAHSIATALKSPTNWQFNLSQAVLIFVGTFMYAAVFINPRKISNELKQSNGFIPGVKPGLPTAKYIDRVTSRVIFPGAIFLALVAMMPSLVSWHGIGITKEFSRYCGGTSLLIVIGVILEVINHVNGHLHMAHYDDMLQNTTKVSDL